MKKVLFFAVALTMVAGSAMAATPGGKIGIGFLHYDAPIGARIVMNEKVALDVSFVFNTENDGDRTDFNLMGAVPIRVIDTEKANLNVMPGISFYNMGAPSGGDSSSLIELFAALEVEYFLSPAFAVHAAHGLGVSIFSPGGDADSSTDFGTFGSNWTSLGFHFYIPQQ